MVCKPQRFNDIDYLHNDDVVDIGSVMNAVRTITYDRAKVDARQIDLIKQNIASRLEWESRSGTRPKNLSN